MLKLNQTKILNPSPKPWKLDLETLTLNRKPEPHT